MPKVASARISEKQSINGVKGDQTKKELCVSNLSDFGQTITIRWKSKKLAQKFVKIMLDLVNNENIGYGQADRRTSYNEGKRLFWNEKDIPKIKKCNTDCSMLVAIAIDFTLGSAKLPYNTTTCTLKRQCQAYPKYFEILPIAKKKKLGDIELKEGKHVVAIVEVK